MLGGVEGQEVLLGRTATEGVFDRSVKNHEVLVFLEVAGVDALLHPGGVLALRAERLVQLTGVDGVDEAITEGGAGADGDETLTEGNATKPKGITDADTLTAAPPHQT
ncbi:MAG: hypothetical protein RDU24_09470 [Humidesulfovibrio sp.]|nr:hypothetical protein [Humidesulfovibrio sp.]MDQ7835597.1 hypothetical protein [Humidesulfovibrio sp.]